MAKKKTVKKAVEKTEKKPQGRVTWNAKVAKSRNKKEWRQRIMEGKTSVPLSPTLLRQRRLQEGYSQDRVAGKVNLSPTTYGDVERGRRPVKKPTADKIAEMMGSAVHFLFDFHTNAKGKLLKNKFVARKAE